LLKNYMQERQTPRRIVDDDNIEIGVKSMLRREFDVSLPLDALKERGDIVAKFAYANWSRQEPAVRQMAENAVQMVQRLPSPRGDKNGADINLALDALEMAFTHRNVNAFAIISGDSDFIPLVNKLEGLRGNHLYCRWQGLHLEHPAAELPRIHQRRRPADGRYAGDPWSGARTPRRRRGNRHRAPRRPKRPRPPRSRRSSKAAVTSARAVRSRSKLAQAMPLVERALSVLQRRGVQPQPPRLCRREHHEATRPQFQRALLRRLGLFRVHRPHQSLPASSNCMAPRAVTRSSSSRAAPPPPAG
jgi:hypothetical protein